MMEAAHVYLVNAVLSAWDKEFARPAETVDAASLVAGVRHAQLAVETVIASLVVDGWASPFEPGRPEPDEARLSRLLAAHRARAFPAGELHGGLLELSAFGAAVYGWADQALAGSLPLAALERLLGAQGRLRRSVPTFPDVARSYFMQLLEIAALALRVAISPTT